MAKQRAQDLSELNVDIELFPMPKPESEDGQEPKFNIKKFFANIITYDEEEQNANPEFLGIEGAKNRIFELMKRIRQKEFTKRV